MRRAAAARAKAEALIAATRTSAEIMGQADRHGTIAVGMRADLVLVDGRPDEDIADLWKVARVWKAGSDVPLRELRARQNDPVMTPLPTVQMTGPILTGARRDGRTDLDTLPVDSTDAGSDHSDIAFVHRHGPDGARARRRPVRARKDPGLRRDGSRPGPRAALELEQFPI